PRPLGDINRGRVRHHLGALLGHLRAVTARPPRRSAGTLARLPRRHNRLAFLVNRQECGCPGSGARTKPNLIGVLEATVPSPRDHSQRQTLTRARRHQQQNGVTSSTPRSSPATTTPATPQHNTPPSRLDTSHALRHPGTGHGAGRRTGSTPTAEHAGPRPPRPAAATRFEGTSRRQGQETLTIASGCLSSEWCCCVVAAGRVA